jgi:UDP-glucose 4-epimerase
VGSKYAAKGYCRLAALLHGLSTISLRYANVHGPRQDLLGEGGVIAMCCGRLRQG